MHIKVITSHTSRTTGVTKTHMSSHWPIMVVNWWLLTQRSCCYRPAGAETRIYGAVYSPVFGVYIRGIMFAGWAACWWVGAGKGTWWMGWLYWTGGETTKRVGTKSEKRLWFVWEGMRIAKERLKRRWVNKVEGHVIWHLISTTLVTLLVSQSSSLVQDSIQSHPYKWGHI